MDPYNNEQVCNQQGRTGDIPWLVPPQHQQQALGHSMAPLQQQHSLPTCLQQPLATPPLAQPLPPHLQHLVGTGAASISLVPGGPTHQHGAISNYQLSVAATLPGSLQQGLLQAAYHAAAPPAGVANPAANLQPSVLVNPGPIPDTPRGRAVLLQAASNAASAQQYTAGSGPMSFSIADSTYEVADQLPIIVTELTGQLSSGHAGEFQPYSRLAFHNSKASKQHTFLRSHSRRHPVCRLGGPDGQQVTVGVSHNPAGPQKPSYMFEDTDLGLVSCKNTCKLTIKPASAAKAEPIAEIKVRVVQHLVTRTAEGAAGSSSPYWRPWLSGLEVGCVALYEFTGELVPPVPAELPQLHVETPAAAAAAGMALAVPLLGPSGLPWSAAGPRQGVLLSEQAMAVTSRGMLSGAAMPTHATAVAAAAAAAGVLPAAAVAGPSAVAAAGSLGAAGSSWQAMPTTSRGMLAAAAGHPQGAPGPVSGLAGAAFASTSAGPTTAAGVTLPTAIGEAAAPHTVEGGSELDSLFAEFQQDSCPLLLTGPPSPLLGATGSPTAAAAAALPSDLEALEPPGWEQQQSQQQVQPGSAALLPQQQAVGSSTGYAAAQLDTTSQQVLLLQTPLPPLQQQQQPLSPVSTADCQRC